MTPARLGRFCYPLFFALFALAAAAQPPAQSPQLAATYAHGTLAVAIPYQTTQAGSGKLTVEVLDPENQPLGRAESRQKIAAGSGSWREVIPLPNSLSLDDLVWQRLRYRFDYDGNSAPPIGDTQSVSEILRRPVLRILGQTQYIAGSRAAVRVVVSDARTGEFVTGALRIELLVPGRDPLELFTGNLNRRGTVAAGFDLPSGLACSCQMRFQADTPIGETVFTQPVELKNEASILLTTEKPIYQPSQVVHIRALALDRASHHAAGNHGLTFEIEDPRGNKVFRKATQTDKFGIASAEFTLADEVNLGAYHLRAAMGSEQAASTAELTFNVERYVLPKFKVQIDFDKKDRKPRRDYRPGDRVTGTVRANYFFGKPVDGADVTVKISAADVAVFDAASSSGKTDAQGNYRFDLKLPAYFAGRPLSQGAAQALVEATVTDSAAHAESRGEPITVSASPLLITAIPEGGALVPNVENDVFILTSYPDGSPARTTLTVHLPARTDRIPLVGELPSKDRRLATDDAGVAVLRFTPGPGLDSDSVSLRIDADDGHGSRVASDVPLTTRSGADQILLHTDRAVIHAGDAIALKVLSTRAHGTAYIDVVEDGQTILTRDVDLENGQAALSIDATPAMAGTLDIDAYLFGRDGQPVADRRLVFVEPAEELKISATTDAPSYLPGAEAQIRFHVTNASGQGVEAALGLQIVDEAVFALAEQQPGFAKVFFYLEQELMKPRYEIHSLSMGSLIQNGAAPLGQAPDENRAVDARALFAATEMALPAKLDVESGRSVPQEKFAEYQERYQDAFSDQARQLAAALSERMAGHNTGKDIFRDFDTIDNGAPPRDAWNNPLRIETTGWDWRGTQWFRVVSAGPDRHFGTGDDLALYLEERTGVVVSQPGASGEAVVRIEHDMGPFNGRAGAVGAITDQSGAEISAASVVLRPLAGGSTRAARSDEAGWFNFAALPAGHYRLTVTAPGFRSVERDFTLAPRDRAVFSITLAVGAANEVVMVAAPPPMPAAAPEAGAFHGAVGAVFGERAGPWDQNGAMHGNVNAHASAAETAVVAGSRDIMQNELVSNSPATQTPAAPHIRSYFPEALYIDPEILTDSNGDASISIPVAYSITTWRMAMLASTASGALGSADAALKVFQDFFVDLDLPVTLTQGDRVTIPVAVYNYSGSPGKVTLDLQPNDWYALDNDSAEKTVAVDAGAVAGARFTLAAKSIGKFKLTLTARMEGADARQDVVVREIEVVPNGREQDQVFNGRLETQATSEVKFPANAIAGASSIVVRLYPGPISQVIEGMDSILRMPYGCFEQTSSSTYPNVLALDYMKRTSKLTPEIHARAEGYIATGYQRLLTFEVPGGGFSWFGQAPANKILTAYGLMEFSDMSKVADVDPRLIERTRNWLIAQQQPDGSWNPDTYFINEGATNRFNTDRLRIAAYLAWSLAETGYRGEAVAKAKQYIESYSGPTPDAYTLALIANFAVAYGQDRDFTRRAIEALLDARSEHGDQVSWTTPETSVYSTGESAAVETTGLAVQALLKWGQATETVRKALNFIAAKKDADGNWGTTQATIMALRALLMSTELSAEDVRGTVDVLLDGKPGATLQLDAGNNDLFHEYVFKQASGEASVPVELRFTGSGSLTYQVVGRSFVPWTEKPAAEPLSITVAYDRTHLAEDDVATAEATIHNNLPQFANMVMVDLGITPGFDLLSEDLQAIQEKTAGAASGRLEKFSLTATQAILYFNSLAPGQTVALRYRLRAKYPIRASTFASRVYEYYDPQVSAIAPPAELEVTAR